MGEKKYILALDQGTTSSRAIIFDRSSAVIASAQRELTQLYPKEGWVEHDPMEIWNTQYAVLSEALGKAKIRPQELAAIGITNQRETTIMWNRNTGKPVHNAIVWQCRRTAPLCDDLKKGGWAPYIAERTGLVVDAYFSATKVKWLLENVGGVEHAARNGDLLFGTVDSWLLWNLTGGKIHATDYTNASRTMLFDIQALAWDEKLLDALGIPAAILPEVLPSVHTYGCTASHIFDGEEVPICGIAGDQQAALFGQACFKPGTAKNTYGTGGFLMMNTGNKAMASRNGLITTIAFADAAEVVYALEGSVFIAGAAVQWLRDELQLIQNAADTEYFASQVPSSGGVYVVPAFAGLGAPYWDMRARGAVLGLTRGSTRNHIIRATLESIAYQTKDVVNAVQEDSGIPVSVLKVDGGASVNNFLMQFQADMLGVPVARPEVIETTALGAAYLAGLGSGFWKNREELADNWRQDTLFMPRIDCEFRDSLYAGWRKAVERSSAWEEAY